ncbi:MAG: class I SAM-dependent methyltransferase [Dehalococcoidia bacterium]
MTVRPEERRTAREYDRWLREPSLSSLCMRLLLGRAGTYLVNTPVLELPAEVGLKPHHRVLDLGCGEGRLTAALANRAGLLHEPIGVDISPRMLRLGERSATQPRVERVAAAATRLPFADASFHLVVAAYLFKHLEDDTLFRVLLEASRVLKPGGIVLAWEFAPTGSARLDRFHRWLLTPRVKTCNLRTFSELAPYALYSGYKYVDRKQFRLPFLFPPIPRVAVMLQKAHHETIAPDAPCDTMTTSKDEGSDDQ